MMMVLGVLAGAVLGARYRVLCLVPATVIGIVTVAVLDRLNGVLLGSTVLTAVVLAVALQIGYLIGAVAQLVLFAAPSGRIIAPKRLRDQPARVF